MGVNPAMYLLRRIGEFQARMAQDDLVATTDLIAALKNHQITAAGLDTLADEATYFGEKVSLNQVPDDYKELSQMDNVLITPHVAFVTQTAIRNMVAISLNDVVKVAQGQHSKNEIRL